MINNPEGKNCSVYLPVDHDKACEGQDPPGKPIPEKKVDFFRNGRIFQIYKSGYYSCKDNPDTPEILTGYGDYYLVYGGPWDKAMVPAKRVRIVQQP